MALKLSPAQLKVLKEAYERYVEWNMDRARSPNITTSRQGKWSISPNTCKSLTEFDPALLAPTGWSNEFVITKEGRREYERQRTPNARKQSDPNAALEAWKQTVNSMNSNREQTA